MRKWIFLGVIVLLIGSSVIPEIIRGESECTGGDELFNEGRFQEALAVYTALLELDNPPKCAKEGEIKAKAALKAEAMQLYKDGVAFEKSGQRELAREAYINALRKNPDLDEASEALYRIETGTFLDSLANLLETLNKDLKVIGGAILTVIIILLAYLAIWWRILPWIANSIRNKPQLDIECFDMGATNLDIGKGLAAKVEDEFKKVIHEKDKPMAHLVEGPTTLKPPAEIKSGASPIKVVSELIEWAFPQKVISLCGCLQKSNEYGAGLSLKLKNNQTGEIIDAQTIWQKDCDLEFKIPKRNDQSKNTNEDQGLNSQNTTKKDIDASPYYCLAESAAVWTLFRLIEYEEKETDGENKSTPTAKLGTENWQSYVFFRQGLRLDMGGEKKKAQEMYQKALHLDPKNRAALDNFAYSKIEEAAREKDPYKYEVALKLLERTVMLSEEYEQNLEWLKWTKKIAEKEGWIKDDKNDGNNNKGGNNGIHVDNMWFVAKRHMANTYSYKGNYKKGQEKAEELLSEIKEITCILRKLEKKENRRVYYRHLYLIPRHLKKTCKKMNHLDYILKKIKFPRYSEATAPVERYLEEAKDAKKYLDDMVKIIKMQSAIRIAQNSGNNNASEKAVDAIKRDLSDKINPSSKKPCKCTLISNEPEKKYKCTLISTKLEEIGKCKHISAISNEIHYDLACYFSVLGQKKGVDEKDKYYNNAITCLKHALLKGGDSVRWAKSDPDLEGVRMEKKKDFDEQIWKYNYENLKIYDYGFDMEIKKMNTEEAHQKYQNPLVGIIVFLSQNNKIAVFKQGKTWKLPEQYARGDEWLKDAVYRILLSYVKYQEIKIDSYILLSGGNYRKDAYQFNYVVFVEIGKQLEPIKPLEWISKKTLENYKLHSGHKRLLSRYFDKGLPKDEIVVPVYLPFQPESKEQTEKDKKRLERTREIHAEYFPMPSITVDGLLLKFTKKCEFQGIILERRSKKVDREPRKWAFPAGFVCAHERVSEALAREIREEIGIILEKKQFLSVFKYGTGPYRDPKQFAWTQFLVVYTMEEPRVKEKQEIDGVGIFLPHEIPYSEMAFDHGDILKEFIDHIPHYIRLVEEKENECTPMSKRSS